MRKKKKSLKRVAALALAGAMTASTVAMPALADTYYLEDGSITVAGRNDSQYVTQEGNTKVQDKEDCDVTIKMDNPDTGSAITVTNNTITLDVREGDVTVTIEDVNIEAKGNDTPASGNDSAVTIVGDGTNDDKSDGDTSNDNDHTATIEIDGDNFLQGAYNGAGIEVGAGADLVIQDKNPSQVNTADSLNAKGGSCAAGIGADGDSSAGDITIEGGTVTATGGDYGAGIGGGYQGGVGDIAIEGGTVTANGGLDGAGIGGSCKGEAGDIAITDSEVTAKGGYAGAGIGSGYQGGVGDIAIEDSTVTATGGLNGAGIGGSYQGGAGDIAVEGSTVTATGGNHGAGIGSGYQGGVGDIAIEDSTVTANGGNYGAGIGGCAQGGAGDIAITDSEVTATGGWGGTGIGGGYQGGAGDIAIEGSTVTATGSNSGAGIGGGYSSSSTAGDITITDSEVTAKGGYAGAGIGGGYQGGAEDIAITDGKVTATGGNSGAGIGGGYSSSSTAGDITITDSEVTATGGWGGTGIGGGHQGGAGDIAITDGKVTATGGDYAAGIGGGNSSNATAGDIAITDGEITAIGGNSGAGIGGGYSSSAESITITGGEITATGGYAGAGIGSGREATATVGDITIEGSTVTANGGMDGAGIGGGCKGEAGDIAITDGKVTATGGNYAAGIGGGYQGEAGDIAITGGKVTSNSGNYAAGIGGGYEGNTGDVTIGGDADISASGSSHDIGAGQNASATTGTITIKEGAHVTMLSGNEERDDAALNKDELYTTGWVKYGNTGTEKAGTLTPPDCYDTSSDVVAMQARYTLEELAGFAPSVTLNGDKTHSMDGVTILYQLVDAKGNAVGSATTEKPTAVGTYTVQYQVKSNDGRLYSTVTKEMGIIVVHEDCYGGTATTSGAGRVKAEEVDIVVTPDTTATNVGTIKVYYNGSEEKPTAAGDYTVTYALIPSDTVHYDTVTGMVGTLVIHEDCYSGTVTTSGAEYVKADEVDIVVTPDTTATNVGAIKVYYNGSEEKPTAVGDYTVTYALIPSDTVHYDTVTGMVGTLVIHEDCYSGTVTTSGAERVKADEVDIVVTPDTTATNVGTIKVYYNGSEEKPTAAGDYTVTYALIPSDTVHYDTVTGMVGTLVIHEDCYSGTVTTSGAERVKADEVDIVVTPDTTATNVGTIKVYYNGSEEKPTAVGDYTVTYALIPSDTVHYDTVTGTVGTLVIHEDCYKGEVVASGLDGENPAEVVLNKLTENTEHLAGTKIYFNGSEELPTNPGEYLVTYRLVSADSKYYDDVVGALGTLVIPVPSVETEGVYYLVAINAQIRVKISSSEQDKTVVEINNVSEEVLTYFEKVVESDVITIQNAKGETLQFVLTGNTKAAVVIYVRGKNGKIITLYGRWA